MGFGFPTALGAKVAFPDRQVIDIDGDGSFLMNIQELACAHIENIPAKVIILNNQHLGMVVQWEDRFYNSNRGHTFLGDPKDRERFYPGLRRDLCRFWREMRTGAAQERSASGNSADARGRRMLSLGCDGALHRACATNDSSGQDLPGYHYRRPSRQVPRLGTVAGCRLDIQVCELEVFFESTSAPDRHK